METKNREKLLLIAAGACVAFLVLKWLIISPLIASWHRRADHIADLRKSLADGDMLIRRQDSIRSQWDRMSTNALSSTPTVAERQLFDAFDRWVRASGVTESSFKPELKPTDDNYSVMECRAEVTGNSQAVGKFLDNMKADPMGARLQSLELTARDDTGSQLSLVLEMSGLLLPAPSL